MRKITLLAALFASTVALLVGCGGGTSAPGNGTAAPGENSEQPAPPEPQNSPPSAVISNNGLGRVGSTYVLYGDQSYDPDNDALTAKWRLVEKPAGSIATLSPAEGLNARFTPDQAGTYVIELTVSDGDLSDKASISFISATPIGGELSGATVLSRAYSPYMLTSDATIPAGSSLTIERGVTLYSSQVLRRLGNSTYVLYARISGAGALHLNGASDSRIKIYNARIQGLGSHMEISHTDFAFDRVDMGCCTAIAGVDNVSNSGGSTSIKDSTFGGHVAVLIASPSEPSSIARNVFSYPAQVYARSGYMTDPIYVGNNLFKQSSLNVYTTMEQRVQVELNTFDPRPGGYSLYLEDGSNTTSFTFQAASNYWNIAEGQEIQDLIRDGNMNGGFTDYVQYSPHLTSPAPSTPSL